MNTELIDQNRKRASYACDFVKSQINYINNGNNKGVQQKKLKNFKTMCRNLPSLFQSNSSMAVLLYLKSKTKKNENENNGAISFYKMLDKWISEHEYMNPEKKDLLTYMVEIKSKECINLDHELKALSVWIRRGAEAFIEKDSV